MIKAEHQVILKEEEAMIERVKLAVRDAALKQDPDMARIAERLVELRDEAAVAPEKDLPTLFDQLNIHQAMAKRTFSKDLPDMRAPYFAHMILEEDGEHRDILVGHKTFLDTKNNVTIIDWRNAPLAKVFFNFREGDDFEVELPGRIAKGRMYSRRVINFSVGKLASVGFPGGDYVFKAGSGWQARSALGATHLAGGEASATRKVTFGLGRKDEPAPEILALLDKDQYRLINEDHESPLLILGGAGSGKTTVALHRLAVIHANHPKRYPENKLLVVVPEEGLVRLSRKLLKSLALEKVRLITFDEWISARGQYLFNDLPKNIYHSAPSRVSRLKRHGAVAAAFPDLEARRIDLMAKILKNEIPFYDKIDQEFKNLSAKHLRDRLQKLEKLVIAAFKEFEKKSPKKVTSTYPQTFNKLFKSLYELNDDRMELFSSKPWLTKIIESSKGTLEPSIVNEVLAHSRLQFAESPAEKYASYSEEALTTIDSKAVDEDTPEEIANTMDVEDHAVLQALLFHYTGEYKTTKNPLYTYAHMVIDEAQDISGMELRALGNALEPDGGMTVAGDALQQTTASSVFSNWDDHLLQLGIQDAKAHHLKTSYRCPGPIMNFAYDVLGPLASGERPKTVREGVPVRIDKVGSVGYAIAVMLEELEELFRNEPRAAVSIICANFDSAKEVYAGLKPLANVRLVYDGEFDFVPGVDVTDASQVKGLEWDYIILPDVDAQNYPETDGARRILHVAATRAIHQLWVLAVGNKSRLIKD